MAHQKNQIPPVSAHLLVSGIVQGVGYRAFSYAHAVDLKLVGTVRNCSDGRVELNVKGSQSVIKALILKLKEGPARSRVDAVDIAWEADSPHYDSFSIVY